MLNLLTDDEVTTLAKLVLAKRHADGEALMADTPLNQLFGKLCDEVQARQQAKENAAKVADYEAEHAAKLAKLDAEYPVAVGDMAEVKIGKRTYRARVEYRSEAPAGATYAHNARALGLTILRKDGQPNKAMNGAKGTWQGIVQKSDIKKLEA